MSLIGSSLIVFKILRDFALNWSMMPYERIIFGLSTFDILSSITLAINPFLKPRETGNTWAFGSPATCQASGVLTQLSLFWAWWYNGILSYYFLLTVLSQVRLKNYVRIYEPWLHLSGIYFLITSIIGYRRGWYGALEIGRYCWVTDPILEWIFGLIPIQFTNLSLIINYSIIYAIVRKSLRSSEHETVAGPTSVQERIKREAMTLMFLYVAFFQLATLPGGFIWGLETYFGFTKDNLGKIYPLLVLDAIFLPLQGFFNFFVYLKPTYTRFRAANPNKPMHFVLHQALFDPEVPQFNFSNDQSFISNDQSGINAIAEGSAANPNQVLFNSNFRPHASSSNSSSSSDASSASDASSSSA